MTISYTSTPGLAELGGYAVSITDTNGVPYPDGTGSYPAQTRTFPVDTSFEPYRREAFRHKSIPGQRQAIQMTNIMGEGTVNTEGLWRREQREWNQGAGQQYLDHKDDDQPGRFYSSKGVDVFNYPYQATLLPDVQQVAAPSNAYNLQAITCGKYIVMGYSYAGTVYIKYVNTSSGWTGGWSGATSTTFGTTYGGSTPHVLYDIAANSRYVFAATEQGIWFLDIIAGATTFQLYAGIDPNSTFYDGTYTGGYNMVKWANDQLIAASGPSLYAFQPRNASTYGNAPSGKAFNQPIVTMYAYAGGSVSYGAAVQCKNPTGVVKGQTVNLSSVTAQYTSGTVSVSGTTVSVTTSTGVPHGMVPGSAFTVRYHSHSGGTITDSGVVDTVPSSTSFTYTTTSAQATNITNALGTGFYAIVSSTAGYGIDGNYTVAAIIDNYTFAISLPTTSTPLGTGGRASSLTVDTQVSTDLLFTHENPNWIWSDATSGETQIYFAGYSLNGYYSDINVPRSNGCIYRSALLGSSTTSSTNVQAVSTSTVAQPFQLVSPIQALPMSPDEYPTCIQSYLNYIFIGTNRGIRMAQTLSIYDPTATATGDLKSGPLIPNVLQPLSYPVTAIIGDGRFVWFAWNNYDSYSTGLGKLDLTTYIAGDPLAPVYASDLMIPYTGTYNYQTGAGMINSLAWDPWKSIPIIAVGNSGIWQPYATNVNGVMKATQYVASGTLTTSIFDYGIPDQKAPVYFEYGGVTPSTSYIQANVVCEPLESFALTLPISAFTSPTTIGTATKEYPMPTVSGISNPKSSQFQVTMTLHAGTGNTTTPIMYRWTLKSFPNVVSGTNIMVVLQLFSVDVVDGAEVYMDPYDNFYWLESLRQAQNLVTYQEGPLSANIAIIESLDWIPHKRRNNYENGFEGDCVVTLKTLGPYSYSKPST